MKKYLFYSLAGSEYAPDGSEVENCQILGIEEASTPQGGLEKLLKENTWIEEKGYPVDEIKWKLIVDESD